MRGAVRVAVWPVLFVLGAWGCSSEEACDSNIDCPPQNVCVLGTCEPGGSDAAPNDTSEPDADSDGGGSDNDAAAPDTGDEADAAQPDDTALEDDTAPDPTDAVDAEPAEDAEGGDADLDAVADTAEPDTDDPADVDFDIAVPDTTPPEVVSISPANGAEGVPSNFVVQIEFSEPVRPETVDVQTIYILDVLDGGKKITGQPQLSDDGITVSMAPFLNTVKPGRPYRAVVSTIVQDTKGNKLPEQVEALFYTAPLSVDSYANLARQFAPFATQAIGANPSRDYPTRFDFDGNFLAVDNADALGAAKSIVPAVYWDAAETHSHVFLTYTFLYPLRDTQEPGSTPVHNDIAATTIVVEKSSVLPIAAVGYGRKGSSQDLFTYAVEGSYLAGKALVNETAPLGELFSGLKFEAYLTSPSHQSCSWAVGGPGDCELNAGILLQLTTMEFEPADGEPTTLTKTGQTWPGKDTVASYELISAVNQWWPRRHLVGDEGMWGNVFDYAPAPGRPGGDLDELPLAFYAAPGTSGGRPPWAWKWSPSGIGNFVELPEGTFFLDPAYFFAKRHVLEDEPWDPGTSTGWSLDYCFHAYLGIDNRGKNAACPAEIIAD